ncbi:MAG: S46 family peptidase [Acidobacteria bacterium]|nr:S46 family peptidase [Acidobacteriota bacterium]MBI3426390.1 S46 family peptidase [Acidobacteriota bacterium]
MSKFPSALIVVVLLSFTPVLWADEGMWTFDNPPLRFWKEKYSFEPTQAWLDHIRLSTVRLNESSAGGATGCLVGPDGLLLTNQHVGAGQVSKLSPSGRDFVKEGYYARTRDEELRCPDMVATVLVKYEDVTQRIRQAVKPGATPAEAAEQRRLASLALEKEQREASSLSCEVVSLYNGGEYWLYYYKRYTDVRLVFVPEEQIAYFGGDYDNFTFPRYSLDIAFLRVYENGQPLKPQHYLKWASQDVCENELVFVPGFPGSSARLSTVAQLRYQRDHANPTQIHLLQARLDAVHKYSARGEDQRRQVAYTERLLSNALKRFNGQQAGLLSVGVFKKKVAEEQALRKAVLDRPNWQKMFGDPWQEIQRAYQQMPSYGKRLAYSNLAVSRAGTLASFMVRYAEEAAKPDAQRYEEFREARLQSLRFTILAPSPLYLEMEEALLAAWLSDAQQVLGAQDPFVVAALNGQTPAAAVKAALGGTQLHKVEFRRQLFEGGPEAIAKADDPLLALARRIEPVMRHLRAWNETNVLNVEASAGERVANARFAVYGKSTYPDANFNLRIAYGTVAGYDEGALRVPFKTTFFGLFERAFAFGKKEPFGLPQRWLAGQSQLNLGTPLNFVYNADTIGGNSGSPVINRRGEIVGINFDGNMQKLVNRWLYVDEEHNANPSSSQNGSRAVGVHTAAIIEALQKLYDAGALVKEIKGD